MTDLSNASRVFDVLSARQTSVEAALVSLNKRAARKSLPLLSWTWGKAHTEILTVSRDSVPSHAEVIEHCPITQTVKIRVVRMPLTLIGATPKYAGWRFIAALQHLDGGNLVRAIPGEVVPVQYRECGPHCDHCKVSRRRNDTFVLRHEDGRTVQVGSTCIGDFLGSDDAGRIAGSATLLADASALISDESGENYGGGERPHLSTDFLAFVAFEMRSSGWVSRGTARERCCAATADIAFTLLTSAAARAKREAKPTEEDIQLAHDASLWAENLSDAEVGEPDSFLWNLRVASRTGLVTHRTAGIIGATIIGYQNYLGKERLKAQRAATPKCDTHIGNVKERLTVTARLDFVTGYETQYGYTTVLKFRTEDGALLVWKASSTDVDRSCVGKTYTLTGTIVKHDEFRGEKQTLVNRCKLVEIQPSAQAA